ncbi:hypothetical protein ID866_7606 [Astraeus odoratus]|nr:hypothetical protein ID866_7606 [Astraeus odoratus]
MGNLYSLVKELCFPPAPTITIEDIPDMTGKVVLITGANSGIGKETARVLLNKNAKVWIACRDTARGEAALKELKEDTGRDAHLLKLNLASLRSIKQSVEEFLSKETQLHVLCNNAGIMGPDVNLITDEGYDLQFGTNVVGHFFLTNLLLPILLSTAKSSSGGTVRVINVSSSIHWVAKVDFDTFKDSHKRKSMSPVDLYSQSKHNCTGGIMTKALYRYLFTQDTMGDDVSLGALTQLYASTFPDCESMSGKYLVAFARLAKPRPDTQDPHVGKKLWTWLEEEVAGV